MELGKWIIGIAWVGVTWPRSAGLQDQGKENASATGRVFACSEADGRLPQTYVCYRGEVSSLRPGAHVILAKQEEMP